MLTIQNLTVVLQNQTILENVSLEVKPGEIVAVLGPNGAGKSTLIRAISSVIPVQNGSIRLNNTDIQSMPADVRAKHIAVVPQAINMPADFKAFNTVLLGRTAHNNWLGSFTDKDEEITCAAMRQTSTLQLKDRLVGELSGGEQQRVLLARALVQQAPVLLLDEPTAHLDMHHQVNIMDHLEVLAKQNQLSVLVTMHDLNLAARYATRMVLLNKGSIAASGSSEAVFQKDLLSEVYQIPLDVIEIEKYQTKVILPYTNQNNHNSN